MIGELFKQSFSVNFVTGTLMEVGRPSTPLLAIPATCCWNIALSKPLIDAGKLIPLGTTDASRSSFLPDVPTLKEAGAKVIDVSGWVGTRRTEGRIRRHRGALYLQTSPISVQIQELRNILAGLKALPVVNSPDEFGNELRQERQMWDRVIKKAGISLE